MSDKSEKTSGARRRSGIIIPDHKEASDPGTALVVKSSTSHPHVIPYPTNPPTTSSSHSGTLTEFKLPYYLAEWSTGPYQAPRHDTKEDPKAADGKDAEIDKKPVVTPKEEKGKLLTEEEEKQAVEEAYKALVDEPYTPPSR
ncbi:hypothetical protein MMC26_000586 [Xylographa opegraphella]|nr:hypothetical protein [Xylographa opegraphella]